jgi:hypothetical protein
LLRLSELILLLRLRLLRRRRARAEQSTLVLRRPDSAEQASSLTLLRLRLLLLRGRAKTAEQPSACTRPCARRPRRGRPEQASCRLLCTVQSAKQTRLLTLLRLRLTAKQRSRLLWLLRRGSK